MQMGRGLSSLQHSILRFAAHQRGLNRKSGVDAYFSEILHRCMGWRLEPESFRRMRLGQEWHERLKVKSRATKPNPNPTVRATFRAKTVSLLSAVSRLEKRKLVELLRGADASWIGVRITKAGIDTASTHLRRNHVP